jgi:hypothetical protein
MSGSWQISGSSSPSSSGSVSLILLLAEVFIVKDGLKLFWIPLTVELQLQTQHWSILEPVHNKTMKAIVTSAAQIITQCSIKNEGKAPQFFLRFDLPWGLILVLVFGAV